MKILNKYRFVKGGATPVARLVPPDASKNEILKSISVTSIVDALCEGPIYGLVDQFGKKVYGLDMLKGIYLNKIPVMNALGEYNFRSILMEINLGTENQQPLANFKEVYIYKPANFKLLGKIVPSDTDLRPKDLADATNKKLSRLDFTGWAKTGGGNWPGRPGDKAQDPFIFVHQIKNKDVKKMAVSFTIEQLYDTVSEGESADNAGSLGTQTATSVDILMVWGLEGSATFAHKIWTIYGTVTSPYNCMYGGKSTAVFSKVPDDFARLSPSQQIQTIIARGSALSYTTDRSVLAKAGAEALNRSVSPADGLPEGTPPQ